MKNNQIESKNFQQKNVVTKQDNNTCNKKDNNNLNNDTKQQKTLTKKENFFQVLKFIGFSISAGVIQLGLTEILTLIGLKSNLYWIAYLIGLVASVIWNFTFNRKFTFKSANNIPLAMSLVAIYYLIFTPCSTLWSNALQTQAHWDETLVTLFSMVINFVTEFLYDRFVVFRNSINTNDLAKSQQQKQLENVDSKLDNNLV